MDCFTQFRRHFIRCIGTAGHAGNILDRIGNIIASPENQRTVAVFRRIGQTDNAVGYAAVLAISLRTDTVQRPDNTGPEVLPRIHSVKSAGSVKVAGRNRIGTHHRAEDSLVIAVASDSRHIDNCAFTVRIRIDRCSAHCTRIGMCADLHAARTGIGIRANSNARGDTVFINRIVISTGYGCRPVAPVKAELRFLAAATV